MKANRPNVISVLVGNKCEFRSSIPGTFEATRAEVAEVSVSLVFYHSPITMHTNNAYLFRRMRWVLQRHWMRNILKPRRCEYFISLLICVVLKCCHSCTTASFRRVISELKNHFNILHSNSTRGEKKHRYAFPTQPNY